MSPVRQYEDASLSPQARVEDLLPRLAVEDKVGLLYHAHSALVDPESRDPYGRGPVAPLIRDRRITAYLVQGAGTGREVARLHNQLQRIAAEHPLRIPVVLSTDPRHSTSDNPLTANASGAFSRWPEPLGLAAIGSADTVEEFADVARREYLAAGIRVALHPQLDLATEPRWARIIHTFGEDAALTGRLGVAYIRGFQGPALGPDSVATMAKHFPGGGPQKDGLDPHFADGREQVYPGRRFEHHLAPFTAAVEVGVAQMMPYYGMPVGTEYEEVGFAFNKGVVTGLLRERLGFDGIVCTDFGVVTGYGEVFPAKAWGVEHLTPSERLVKLLDAGVDQFGGETGTDLLLDLVKTGQITEARLDTSVRRILRERFQLGLFDNRRYVDEGAADRIVGSAAFREAGSRAQRASLTLLTNGTDDTPVLPAAKGALVYAEGVDPAAFDGYATLVDTPEDADLAVLRVDAPSYHDPARGFLGSMHKGSLDFPTDRAAHLADVASRVPTVLDVRLERPAILTQLTGAAALIGSYGTEDREFVEVVFGDGEPLGSLPFDLPRSMAAVEAGRTDVPFDTADPLFRFGHGLRYRPYT
ncbi:MAG: glycoside hydrolase family 3 protein [Streptomycetaceae bacterium]|nr:glycoside hydrolase family 3 protein [Streptomycetaceae bacterium]